MGLLNETLMPLVLDYVLGRKQKNEEPVNEQKKEKEGEKKSEHTAE